MPATSRLSLFAVLAVSAAAVPLLAVPAGQARKPAPAATPAPMAPADAIRAREAGFKEMGAAFKNVMDGMRGEPQLIVVQQSARMIKAHSQNIYRWFPAGSGPRPGVKTAAKAEIWSKPAEFRVATDNLAKAANTLMTAAASRNTDAIRASLRPLGAACKGCHDPFRVPEES
jgi:cytochrome c556